MRGSIVKTPLQSSALSGNILGDPSRRDLTVYLPEGYADSRSRYPAVFFLHGFGSTGPGWLSPATFSPNLIDRLDALIVSKAIPPVIGVFPDGWTSLGGSQWINSGAIGNYQSYLVNDVISKVDQEFRTLPYPESRAVIGKSSGGYAAWALGALASNPFGHMGCHSSDAYFEYCYLPDFPKVAEALSRAGGVKSWYSEFKARCLHTKMAKDDYGVINILAMSAAYSPPSPEPPAALNFELPFELKTGRVRPNIWEHWLSRDPVRFVPQQLKSIGSLKTIFFDCGTRDEFNLQWGARMIAEVLTDNNLQFIYEEFDDGHLNTTYRYDRSLLSIVPQLNREDRASSKT